MPLPPEMDQEIRRRFDELIVEATELIPKMEAYADEIERMELQIGFVSHLDYGHIPEFQSLVVRASSLTEKVYRGSDRGLEVKDFINQPADKSGRKSAVENILGTMQGLQDDYVNGFLDNLEERIVANISSDYMAHVDEILVAGQSDKYDHIFAAVICGVNLENALRQLCARQSPPIKTAKPNRRPKRLGDLIAALQNANVYNALKADRLRAWAKVRNHAAHGEFEEFNRHDVEDMIKGVRNFLADYL